ncbi:MAG: hypothetical protein A2284_17950 [Deltaproteobacteria bacterium RIFOXYA12_FULL_61_11]|nr:MAG: hypothetical protein A2284_17950 [Deltaproteobacteria bacterium RIFOXYA12_FULL_61_11]
MRLHLATLYSLLLRLIITTVPLTYAGTMEISGTRIFPSYLPLSLFIGLAGLCYLFQPRQSLRLDTPTILMLFFIGFILFSAWSGAHLSQSNALKYTIRYLLVLFYLAGFYYILPRWRLDWFSLWRFHAWISAMVAIYGIYQFISVSLLGTYLPLLPNSSAVPFLQNFPRAVGTFMEAGYFSMYLGISILGTLYLHKYRPGFSTRLPLFFLVLAMIFSYSSAGIVALTIAILFQYLREDRRWLRKSMGMLAVITALALSVILMLALNPTALQETIIKKFDIDLSSFKDTESMGQVGSGSTFDRLVKGFKAYNMTRERPWCGHGLGSYGVLYNHYPPLVEPRDLDVVPLNVYLHLLAEQGLCGLVLFLGLLFFMYWQLVGARPVVVFVALNFMAFPLYSMDFIWVGLSILVGMEYQLRHGSGYSLPNQGTPCTSSRNLRVEQ